MAITKLPRVFQAIWRPPSPSGEILGTAFSGGSVRKNAIAALAVSQDIVTPLSALQESP
jgi:hypothetical protein